MPQTTRIMEVPQLYNVHGNLLRYSLVIQRHVLALNTATLLTTASRRIFGRLLTVNSRYLL